MEKFAGSVAEARIAIGQNEDQRRQASIDYSPPPKQGEIIGWGIITSVIPDENGVDQTYKSLGFEVRTPSGAIREVTISNVKAMGLLTHEVITNDRGGWKFSAKAISDLSPIGGSTDKFIESAIGWSFNTEPVPTRQFSNKTFRDKATQSDNPDPIEALKELIGRTVPKTKYKFTFFKTKP